MAVSFARTVLPLPYLTRWSLPAAGLLAGFWIACYACPVPPGHMLSAEQIFWISSGYVLATLFVPILTIAATSRIFTASEPQNTRHMMWRTSVASVWLAPGVLFASESAAFMIAVWAVFALSATRLLRFYTDTPVSNSSQLEPQEMFKTGDPRPLLDKKTLPIAAALLLQSGAMAVYFDLRDLAATMFALATMLLTLFVAHRRPQSKHFTKSIRRLPMLAVCAVLLTVTGLLPYWKTGPLYYGAVEATDWLNSLFGKNVRNPYAPQSPRSIPNADPGNGNYSGVILLPEGGPKVIMLAPPPPHLLAGDSPNLTSKPLSIPFHGVYWIFKYPRTRPPEQSLKIYGSLATTGMHSSDLEPLNIEAHQEFSSPISLACCSQILVNITNQDPQAHDIWLEATLTNRRTGESISLGSVKVKSVPISSNGKVSPASEDLAFNIPSNSEITQFDELTIHFHSYGRHYQTSPRIAIERFTLMPRSH
jgi:hypothetical protein